MKIYDLAFILALGLFIAAIPAQAASVSKDANKADIEEPQSDNETAEKNKSPDPVIERVEFVIKSDKTEDQKKESEEKKPEKEKKKEEPQTREVKAITPKSEAKEEKNSEETKKKAEKRPAILEQDIAKIESLGLRDDMNALGRDLWSRTPREDITKLIKRLPTSYNSEITRRLTMGLLITPANAGLLQGDMPPQPGEDLLTHRLGKLIEIGAYDKALKLYSALDNKEPYHPMLAQLGILSMLLNADKSAACLEYKIIETRELEGAFWRDIGRYCGYVLGTTERSDLSAAQNDVLKSLGGNQEYKKSYSPAEFRKLSIFSKALLTAEQAINVSSININTIDAAPAQDLLILLANENTTPPQRYKLMIAAAENGLVDHSALSAYYRRTANDDQLLKQDWAGLIKIWNDLRNLGRDENPWPHIHKAFDQANSLYELLPFASGVQKAKPVDMPLEKIRRIYEVLFYASEKPSDDWVDILLSKQGDSENTALLAQLYGFSLINLSDFQLKKARLETLNTLFNQNNTENLYFMKNVLETLDKFHKYIHNPYKIYENDFDLTKKTVYKRSHLELINALKTASEKEEIAKTVALSVFALHGLPLDHIDPEQIIEVIKSLNAVGFTNVSRELIAESLLKQENK